MYKDTSKRAVRRHHNNRVKNSRKIHWGKKIEDPKELGKLMDTPTPCSCHMCGNTRKWYGRITKQEEIIALREKDDE